MNKIKYEFTPFDDEEQLEAAIKRLAFIWAHDMGWVPKDLSKNRHKHQELEDVSTKDE